MNDWKPNDRVMCSGHQGTVIAPAKPASRGWKVWFDGEHYTRYAQEHYMQPVPEKAQNRFWEHIDGPVDSAGHNVSKVARATEWWCARCSEPAIFPHRECPTCEEWILARQLERAENPAA